MSGHIVVKTLYLFNVIGLSVIHVLVLDMCRNHFGFNGFTVNSFSMKIEFRLV